MHRQMLKRLLSVSLAIIIATASPFTCLAEQNSLESIADTTEDEDLIYFEDITDDILEEKLETSAVEEIIDENDDISVSCLLSEEELRRKEDLAASLERFDSLTDGVDYETGSVFRAIDSEESAQQLADKYGITLVSYENMIASYVLPEDISVADIIHIGADISNDYPAISPNYYLSNNSGFEAIDDIAPLSDELFAEAINDESIDGVNNEENNEGIESYVATFNSFSDPFLDESYSGSYYQWHHDAIGSLYALADNITGQNVKIALLSTGINPYRGDIDYSKIIESYSTVSGDGTTTDSSTEGYGTFLAGILIAKQDNTYGVGVCPGASLINIKMDRQNIKSVCDAIYKAVDRNADIAIIHTSIDFPFYDMETACDYAYQHGVALFAPVAPTGDSYECWPAAYDSVISVAAIDKSYLRYGESSIGKSIDISAPGTFITSMTKSGSTHYTLYSGTSLACTIAAGEAALILQKVNDLPGFRDKNNNLIPKNSERVKALKSIMQKGAINTGAGTGKGLCYLPKVLGISSMTTPPNSPTISPNPIYYDSLKEAYFLPVSFSTSDYDASKVLYTYNGKTPSFKNGVKDKDSYEGFYTSIDLSTITTETITINAIAVNSIGLASKVSTLKYSLAGIVEEVKIKAPCANVIPGKTVKMTYSVIPSNIKSKVLEWHVSYNGNESDAKAKGITISTTGTVTVNSKAPTGTLRVWAVSKVDSLKISNTEIINIIAPKVKTIKANQKKQAIYLENESINISKVNLFAKFDVTRIDGSSGYITDVYFTSSNNKLAYVDDSNNLVAVMPGSITLTAWASDGSGVKGTLPFDIVQKATSIYIPSNGYDKVAAGKSLALGTPVISPSNSKVKKVTKWTLSPSALAEGIKVSPTGVISTKITTTPGTYSVTAELENPDKTKITKNMTFKVISELVSKMTIDTKKAQVFRVTNAYGASETCSLKVSITGGERVLSKPVDTAFAVSLSNPDILTCTSVVANTDNSITINLASRGTLTGKSKVTISTLDGSNLKVYCDVDVINPVSSVGIAPAAAGINDCVTAGKSLKLKATLGTEYGPISNKNVTWELISTPYATITPQGELKVIASAPNNELIQVKATAKDGSNAWESRYIRIYRNIGKMTITTISGFPTAAKGETWHDDTETLKFYVKAKGDLSAPATSFGGFRLSSSNPKLGSVRFEGVYYSSSDPGYYIYEFKCIGIKKGSTTLKVSTYDGSQSVSYNLKIK